VIIELSKIKNLIIKMLIIETLIIEM
jgi:hypothetical protein